MKRTLRFAGAMAGVLALALLAHPWLPETARVHGQEAQQSRPSIKYVFTLSYPVGGKDRYIAWVASVAEDLRAPAEVRRITAYDSYFSSSPQRVVEFEFDSMADAGKYFARERVRDIFASIHEYGLGGDTTVLRLRSDYAPK